MQINAIWLYYNELSFICCILLLAALIIFYPFTGLSYIDIKTLTFDKIQRMDFDGEEWIITRRTKTKVSSNVPLMEIAKELIERYKGLAKDDFVFPMPSNGTCNDHLKKIATVCGINKEVTFHLSSHSKFFYLLNISELSILKNVTANDLETSYILFLSQLCNIQRTL